MSEFENAIQEINNELYGLHDYIPTFPGSGQHHPHGLVGNIWRIKNPETVRVGGCFLKGRIKKDDLFLCVKHSGDCFQDYIYIEEYDNALVGKPEWKFGSYGIGDSEKIEITNEEFQILKDGGFLEKKE